ncbi:3-ketoacyl-ACP reductase [Paenibacillus sp. FSL H7-0942]|uniref:3-ketoacyl-ACP reductase n=1 Tax=Paenibacillus amylolyticus TaxID=1451 RepID=A0ABD8ARX0_PAEAM|nr:MULTISPECIES: 3-ketoacyl-ACP reductase [Paenibacillus]ETT41268.1 3-ketoacyl-(acyl-carrier-protein) reductase [Paenibacillus sp. FSL R5-192]ETT49073.1 3-ketoacyl-(acyl-carrier-protein) reductase [Paenibacillus sp. FSL H7-689]KLU57657.1 3-ketoacyl-ACP reductase [Paenibacillus sp. VT-400]MCP1423516.1 3-oxoacyl-[acyl-carrier protein] reductase [Paenibacillus xylanexedens]OME97237.1 3-ketoacyl-ACP reductase [Paenibacillus amylolyticus]
MELKNKTAIITGAGKGIGRAIAEALAKEGVHLGLIARTASDLQALQQSLSQEYGVKVTSAVADISDRTQAEAAVAAIEMELGAVDILINNAGIGKFGTFMEMEPEEWERILHVNVMGTYYVTRAVLPSMIKESSGSIINIASTAGERGFATGSAYCASKFALLGMTESLMQEVRKSNIRVTALTPSTVNTELATNAGLKIGDEDRMMQAEDVAELALATLKLSDRVFVKTAGIWTTNPQ